MMTLTLYIGDLSKKQEKLSEMNKIFNSWKDYVNINSWSDLIGINLPPLTVHEQLEIRQYNNDLNSMKAIEERMGIKKDAIETYLKFARYYPNYQPVVI